jgi:hypothetical protein
VAEPRKALSNFPKIRDFFDDQLVDRTPAGRIPRAIMGRPLGAPIIPTLFAPS